MVKRDYMKKSKLYIIGIGFIALLSITSLIFINKQNIRQTKYKSYSIPQAQIYNPKNITISRLTKDPIYRITLPLLTGEGQDGPFGGKQTAKVKGDGVEYDKLRHHYYVSQFCIAYEDSNKKGHYANLETFQDIFWQATLNSPSGLIINSAQTKYKEFIKGELNKDPDNDPNAPKYEITGRMFHQVNSNTPYPYTNYRNITKNFVPISNVLQTNTVIPTATNPKYKLISWNKPISLIRPNWYIGNICLDNYVKSNSAFSKIRINNMDYYFTFLGLLIPSSQIAKIDNFNVLLTKNGHLYALNNLKQVKTLQKGQHYVNYNNQIYVISNKVKIKQLNLGPIATPITSQWFSFSQDRQTWWPKTAKYHYFKGDKSYIKLSDIKAINGQPIKQY